ncbi:MAG: endonuclease [Cyanobacteria bacterium J06623_7]
MTFSPIAISLIAVVFSGFVIAVSLGTVAYFANEKNY